MKGLGVIKGLDVIEKLNVMKKLFIQLSVVIVSSMMLTACPSTEGPSTSVSQPTHVFDPLPVGLPVFAEIDTPFFGHIDKDPNDPVDLGDAAGSLSLFSFSESKIVGNIGELSRILVSKSGIAVVLKLRDSNGSAFQTSLLVSNDSVFKVDHANNEIRMLNHFFNKVCEVLPAETVQVSAPDAITGEITHTIFNENFVYVVTAEGDGSFNECVSMTSKKHFYKLPLNFQFDAKDFDSSKTSELPVVSESLARAKLLFGWVDNNGGGKRLAHGYLGYGLLEKQLNFYNADRQVQWSQPRILNTFPVVLKNDNKYSPEFLFNLVGLESQQYMLQLGQDVFVFDSSSEIFAKAFNEIDTILTDRSLKIALTKNVFKDVTTDIIAPVTALYDSDELLLIDGSKIFKLVYTANLNSVAEAANNIIVGLPDFNIAQQNYLNYRPFSQFDNQTLSCQRDNNPSACKAAQNVASNSWQFITDCEVSLACNIGQIVDNFCETKAEKLISQSNETLCTPSNYLHLSELNTSANDAQFRGYMQYNRAGADYIQDLKYILHDNSLFITARMNDKDIFLRYFYQKNFTSPKLDREQVLFGTRVEHFGLDAYIKNNSLFLSSLLPSAVRSNECYKNYQKVSCDLGEVNDVGSFNSCTSADLISTNNSQLCFKQFTEYHATALFCNQSQLKNALCSDDQLLPTNSLSAEGGNEDAKWVSLSDFSSGVASNQMYLLVGQRPGVTGVNSALTGEGILIDPQLYLVDDSTGAMVGASKGTLKGQVEAVVDAWLFKDNSLGYLDVISEEVKQLGGARENNSIVNKYILNINAPNTINDAIQNTATLLTGPTGITKNIKFGFEFKRPITLQ